MNWLAMYTNLSVALGWITLIALIVWAIMQDPGNRVSKKAKVTGGIVATSLTVVFLSCLTMAGLLS